MIGSDNKTIDLRGQFNILTPRGEAAAVMMVDYGKQRDTVFYGHLIAGGALVRAEACDVKVLGVTPAEVTRAFEPLLTMGVIQAGLGQDHGFDIAMLTRVQMAVNSERGKVDPQVWMPYYKFLITLMIEAGVGMMKNLKSLRQQTGNGSPVARRIEGVAARFSQKLEAIARASGVGPFADDARHLEQGHENVRILRDCLGTVPADPEIEQIDQLKAFLSYLHGALGVLRNDVADHPSRSLSIVTDFARTETEKVEQLLKPWAANSRDISVLARAG